MIKTELKFIVKNSIVGTTGNNSIGGGGVTSDGLSNGSFRYYTMGWSGDTMTTSDQIYNSLYNDGSLQTIDQITGWQWENGYMICDTRSSASLWQPVEGLVIGQTYKLSFQLKDCQGGCSIMPSIWGNNGDYAYYDGKFNQYITIAGQTGTTLSFTPNGDGYAGIINISLTPTGSQYRKIDLYDDESFNLTFQIQTNISNKGSTYSKTMRIPGTQNNNIIFNELLEESAYIDLGDIFSGGTVFLNKKIDAGIYNDTIELLVGFFELQRVVINDRKVEYEGVFYSEIRTIADVIGDKSIVGNDDPSLDISMSEYNHVFTWQNIQNSWTNGYYTGSTGYYYPLIDFADVYKGNSFRVEQFKPACYVKEVWDKIFGDAGYTYSSNFLNSNLFKSLVIPMNNTRRQSELNQTNSKFNVGLENTQTITFSTTSGAINSTASDYVYYDKESGGNFYDPRNMYNIPNFSWTATEQGSWFLAASIIQRLKFTYSGAYGWRTYGNSKINLTTTLEIIQKRGFTYTTVATSGPVVNSRMVNCLNSGDWIFDLSSPVIAFTKNTAGPLDVDIQIGDMFYVNVIVTLQGTTTRCNTQTPLPGTWTYEIKAYDPLLSDQTYFQVDPVDPENYYKIGDNVYMDDVLPAKIKQIKFLSSISNKFNLMFCEDRGSSKNLIIEPYDNFFYTGLTYVDWSNKIDLSKDKWIERIPYLIDKDVNFKLADDSNDILLKTYKDINGNNFGSRKVKNPYFTSGEEGVEDSFSSTFLTPYASTNIIVSKIKGERDSSDVHTDLPTETDYNVRFLARQYITTGNTTGITFNTINVYDTNTANLPWIGNTPPVPPGVPVGIISYGYPYAGFLDNPYWPSIDFNYGDAQYYLAETYTPHNLSWIYWRNKISQYMNPNSKMVTLYLRLNPTDIALLDFRRRIMLNNNLYKINKVIEWSPWGNSTKCELIQEAALSTDAYLTPTTWDMYAYGNRNRSLIPNRRPNYLSLEPNEPINNYVWEDISGVTFPLFHNTISLGSNALVIGNSNFVKGNDNIISGSYNKVDGNKSMIIGSDYNYVKDNSALIVHSDYSIIETGFTNTVLINTSGRTITQSNKTYINDRDVDVLTDETYVAAVSATTLSEANAYTNAKTGDTLTYVSNNYYDTAQADATFSTKGGTSTRFHMTTQSHLTHGEYIVGVDYTGTGSTSSVTLSNADKIDGKVFIIQDEAGNANTKNIFILGEGLSVVNGSGDITARWGKAIVTSDGVQWFST